MQEDEAPDVRRQELAAFLRSRRERIAPKQVGLARGARRRTPGLRREEVAHLSSVGVTWYTWLEQARDIQVSAQVLDSLSRALLLDQSERTHLFALAGVVDPAPETPCPTVTPAMRMMLQRLEPFPTCVLNERYDILAYNSTYGLFLGDLDRLPRDDRNCMWLLFTDEHWRSAIPVDEAVRIMVAEFRASMAEHLAEPAWKALLARLKTLPEFCELWERHEVVESSDKTKHIDNAYVGHLVLQHTSLRLAPSSGGRLVSFVPEDDETLARLERLQRVAASKSASGDGAREMYDSSDLTVQQTADEFGVTRPRDAVVRITRYPG
jgi:hypothetical protein